ARDLARCMAQPTASQHKHRSPAIQTPNTSRTAAWQELAQDGWLDLPDPRTAPLQVRLLDDAALNQAPGRSARRRAAHWALKPAPLIVAAAANPADRLTALVLAVHTTATGPAADMAVIARLCGHSPQQTEVLLDRLVADRTLAAWHHQRDTDEVHWQPAVLHRPASGSGLVCALTAARLGPPALCRSETRHSWSGGVSVLVDHAAEYSGT
ncbi:hypothetical protein ACFV1F_03380, partial [Streptomyces sp. NPDC059590]